MKRILACRTDRIGDFILSLPFLEQIKANYPDVNLDMLVSPVIYPLIKFVPFIDRVFVYDKAEVKGSQAGFKKVLSWIKDGDYDVAIALNPNLRLHYLLFRTGIKRRIGWNIKGGYFLLTDTLRYTKSEASMHEVHYNMLFLPLLGIKKWPRPIPVLKLDKEVNKAFSQITIGIHPFASCPSKRWPVERFLRLSKELLYLGYGLVFIGGQESIDIVRQIIEELPQDLRLYVKNRAGIPLDESVYSIASCDVLISNDSGPVHIASALGIPSVVIFGRNDPALSPARWRPLHYESVYIHKPSCDICLAHKCRKDFQCLRNIEVEDVMEVLNSVLVNVKLREL